MSSTCFNAAYFLLYVEMMTNGDIYDVVGSEQRQNAAVLVALLMESAFPARYCEEFLPLRLQALLDHSIRCWPAAVLSTRNPFLNENSSPKPATEASSPGYLGSVPSSTLLPRLRLNLMTNLQFHKNIRTMASFLRHPRSVVAFPRTNERARMPPKAQCFIKLI